MCASCEWKPWKTYNTRTDHSITTQFRDTRYYCISDVVLKLLQLIVFISATADVDYNSFPRRYTSGRLTMYSYSTYECVSIRTTSDSRVENTESFLVQLQISPSLLPSWTLARTSASVFIQDDDSTLVVS